MKRDESDMNEGWPTDSELDTLFAAARAPTSDDLEAADRFLANHFAADRTAGQPRPRPALRLWMSAALGVAAAVGGLLFLRPVPAELPSSEAYSVYQSALGDGW